MIQTSTGQAAEVLMSAAEVSAYTNGQIALGTLGYWRHVGNGPRWFRLGGRKVVYRKSDVDAWLEASYNEAG